MNANLSPRISKSKLDITRIQKCFEQWDLLNCINKAKKLVLDDQAIKGNSNVNLSVFESYVERIIEALDTYNREHYFLNCFIIRLFQQKNRLPINQAESHPSIPSGQIIYYLLNFQLSKYFTNFKLLLIIRR